jgi:hypothetical protein
MALYHPFMSILGMVKIIGFATWMGYNGRSNSLYNFLVCPKMGYNPKWPLECGNLWLINRFKGYFSFSHKPFWVDPNCWNFEMKLDDTLESDVPGLFFSKISKNSKYIHIWIHICVYIYMYNKHTHIYIIYNIYIIYIYNIYNII